MGYRRKGTRVVVERDAVIHRQGRVTPCMVVDLSEEGVRVRAGSPVDIGEELQISCGLTSRHSLKCQVQVTHTRSSEFGARITNISPEHRGHLREFIDDLIAMKVPRL